jgi:branched-chain amino acid transport system permease protein
VLTFLAEAIADLGAWRPIIIGVLIILVMLVYPGGLHAALQAGLHRAGTLGRRRHGQVATSGKHADAVRLDGSGTSGIDPNG